MDDDWGYPQGKAHIETCHLPAILQLISLTQILHPKHPQILPVKARDRSAAYDSVFYGVERDSTLW